MANKEVPNFATYVVLPLIELTKNSFGENGSNFINCYITEEGYIAVKVEKWEDVLVTAVNNIYYFTDFDISDDQGIVVGHMILYRVTGNHVSDITYFREGRYSLMSSLAKDKIVMFYGLEDTDTLTKVLDGDKRMREKLAESLGISVEKIKEAKSKPADSNFIDITDYLTLKEIV